MRYSDLTTVIKEVPSTIESWIEKELTEDGLLGDVESFITTLENEINLETPTLWMTQHEWKSYDNKPLANLQRLKIPIEFACIDYDADLKVGELSAMNLVGRVIASILKHYRRRQELFNFVKMDLAEIYPNGTINVTSKQEVVCVAGVLVEFVVDVDWFKCSRLDADGNHVIVDITHDGIGGDGE